MFTNKVNITKSLIFVISFIFLYVSIGIINSFELKAQDASQGGWSSSVKPETTSNITGGYVDTTNNKLWLFDYHRGAYYSSINSQGTPEGSWSNPTKPATVSSIQGRSYIDTTNNKLWFFDHTDGAYYRPINSQGAPEGSWSSPTKPKAPSEMAGGYIDTTNNKLWFFEYNNGAYYRSINSQGVPEGSWSSVGEPITASRIAGGHIDTINNKLWLFDRHTGAYHISINSSGVPEGDWSSSTKPATANRITGGYVDTTNNKLWLFNYEGAYYRSIYSQAEGSWSSALSPEAVSDFLGGYVDTTNNKLWLFNYYNGAYYRSIDTINTGSNNGNSSGVPASNEPNPVNFSNHIISATLYGPPVPVYDGDLVKVSGNPDIYIVKFINGKRFRRVILNPDIFNSYGHLSWNNVKVISENVLNAFTISDLVREVYPDGSIVPPGNVYKLYPQGDVGVKRLIRMTQEEFESTFDKDSIYNINHLEASDTFYRRGADSTITVSSDSVIGDIFYGQDPSPDS